MKLFEFLKFRNLGVEFFNFIFCFSFVFCHYLDCLFGGYEFTSLSVFYIVFSFSLSYYLVVVIFKLFPNLARFEVKE